jgi:hypothetical protein
MSKCKKRIISLVILLCTVAISLGAFLFIRHYISPSPHFTINDTLPDGQGKKVKVILLGGQSNASGCSSDDYLKQNVSAEQYAAYQNGYDNVYINYFASGTNESHGFVRCAAKQGETGGFFGPELGMAEKLNELYPDETFFIIKWAWGGTNLYEQWRSPSSGGEVGPLYNSFVEYAKHSLEYLTIKGYDVSVEAMCWMQGEADSMEEESTLNYDENLSNFIGDVRAEFSDYASNNGIAFVDAYIADSFFWKHYIKLNQAKQTVADSSPMNVVIDTIAHGLSITEEPVGEPDIAHYDSLSEIKLGHLFAEQCISFFDPFGHRR